MSKEEKYELKNVKVNELPIYEEIKTIVNTSRQRIAKQINNEIFNTYFDIGELINKELNNAERAEYGKRLILELSRELRSELGKGFLHITREYNTRSLCV